MSGGSTTTRPGQGVDVPVDTGEPSAGEWTHRRPLLGAGVMLAALTTGVALSSWRLGSDWYQYWDLPTIYAIVLAAWWVGPTPSRRVARVAVAMLVPVSLVGGVTLGASGVWIAVANLVAAGTLLLLYRRLLSHRGWAPRTPADLLALLLSVAAATGLGLVLGAYPGTVPLATEPDLAIWWFTRVLCAGWIGSAAAFLLSDVRRPAALRRPSVPHLLALLAVGVTAMALPRAAPDLPLTWVPLVPALWAGMVLTPGLAAAYVLITSWASVAFDEFQQRGSAYGGLSSAEVVDLLLVFASLLTLLLVITRDRRARLDGEIERERREAQDTADIIEAVLDSMHDGFVLFGPEGMERHNPAARRMIGRPLPTTAPESWTSYFGIRSADGTRALTDAEILPRPQDDLTTDRPTPLRVSVADAEGDTKIVAVTSSFLAGDEGAHVLLLFHDVTAEHSHEEELSDFAARVARTLKGPLATLADWIDRADAELSAGDVASGRASLAHARASGTHLGRLIDDYLAFTVTRQGVLRIGDVSLAEIVDEVTAQYRSEAVDGPEPPRFDVDVTHRSRADRALTRRLLANLVGHAVEHARPGSTPHVTLISRDDVEPGWVQVAVADHGSDLSPADLLPTITAEDVQSTGLGLILCHTIVTRHGGRITAEGNEYGGATFRFTLPSA